MIEQVVCGQCRQPFEVSKYWEDQYKICPFCRVPTSTSVATGGGPQPSGVGVAGFSDPQAGTGYPQATQPQPLGQPQPLQQPAAPYAQPQPVLPQPQSPAPPADPFANPQAAEAPIPLQPATDPSAPPQPLETPTPLQPAADPFANPQPVSQQPQPLAQQPQPLAQQPQPLAQQPQPLAQQPQPLAQPAQMVGGPQEQTFQTPSTITLAGTSIPLEQLPFFTSGLTLFYLAYLLMSFPFEPVLIIGYCVPVFWALSGVGMGIVTVMYGNGIGDGIRYGLLGPIGFTQVGSLPRRNKRQTQSDVWSKCLVVSFAVFAISFVVLYLLASLLLGWYIDGVRESLYGY